MLVSLDEVTLNLGSALAGAKFPYYCSVASKVSEVVLCKEIWPQNSRTREPRHVAHMTRDNFKVYNSSFPSPVHRKEQAWADELDS